MPPGGRPVLLAGFGTVRARDAGHMTRILLADDHTVMRNGLRLLLERQPT